MNRLMLLYGILASVTGLIKATQNVTHDSSFTFKEKGEKHDHDFETFPKDSKYISELQAASCKIMNVIEDASDSFPANSEWGLFLESIAKVANSIYPDLINVVEFSNYAKGVTGPEAFTDKVMQDIISKSTHLGGGTVLSSPLKLVLRDLPLMLQDSRVQNILLIFSDFNVNTQDRAQALADMQSLLNTYPGLKAWCIAVHADLDFAKLVCGENVISFRDIEDLQKNWIKIKDTVCVDDATVSPTQATSAPSTSRPTDQPLTKSPHSKAPHTKAPHTKAPSTKHPSRQPSRKPTSTPTNSPTESETANANLLYALLPLLLLLLPCGFRPKKIIGHRADEGNDSTTVPLLQDVEAQVSGAVTTNEEEEKSSEPIHGNLESAYVPGYEPNINPILKPNKVHGISIFSGVGAHDNRPTYSELYDYEAERPSPPPSLPKTPEPPTERDVAEITREWYASIILVSLLAHIYKMDKTRFELNITSFAEGIRKYCGCTAENALAPEMANSEPFNVYVPRTAYSRKAREEQTAQLNEHRARMLEEDAEFKNPLRTQRNAEEEEEQKPDISTTKNEEEFEGEETKQQHTPPRKYSADVSYSSDLESDSGITFPSESERSYNMIEENISIYDGTSAYEASSADEGSSHKSKHSDPGPKKNMTFSQRQSSVGSSSHTSKARQKSHKKKKG